jgi:hypothetical protein
MRAAAPSQLFAGRRLSDSLTSATKAAQRRLLSWDPDALLNAAEADVVEELLAEATFEVPALQRDDAELEEKPTEIEQEHQDFLGRQGRSKTTRFTLVVPIAGPPAFFMMTATTWSPSPIYGEIDQWNGTLRLHCDGMTDPAQIKASFEQTLNLIEQRLAPTRVDVEAHNQRMADEVPGLVAQRRAKLLADRDLQASIGFKIRRTTDAATYAVPVNQRRFTPTRTPSRTAPRNPFVPEPALDEADYEAALAVLRNARNALERNPTMSSKLGEEGTRDLLLVTLNAQFEGKAGGELFNCQGKTDILIREGDRNVFIGECKIFDTKNKQSVETVVSNALSQLLTYLAWRDTKAALLLFIRDANISAVVTKALAAIQDHPNHKRTGKVTSEERHDFVIHANGDTNREIHLAFLPFLIGSRN